MVGKDLGTKVLKDCLYWFQVYFKDPSLMSTVPRPNICCLGKPGPGKCDFFFSFIVITDQHLNSIFQGKKKKKK